MHLGLQGHGEGLALASCGGRGLARLGGGGGGLQGSGQRQHWVDWFIRLGLLAKVGCT